MCSHNRGSGPTGGPGGAGHDRNETSIREIIVPRSSNPYILGVPKKKNKIRRGCLNPAFWGVTSKIWHIPNAQEALKPQLWNNKPVEKGQN